ncbi:MAG: bifunctional riboflavin kinase/FAD synthetase [Oscillospiraceae bacterium]|nr:bifunctional riboflavin kinase/FAD synthetase [Oscillospiraceae bacterium]
MSEKTVIALGFFDGVHLGHAALLKKTLERAAELGATPAAFTFDRSPKEFVTGIPVPLLTTVKEREMTLRGWYDMEKVFVEPFDKAMMTMPWEDFITELLVKKYHAVHLVAGHDFHFGYKNEGSPERLAEKCRELGLGCDIIGCVEIGGETVSSTRIRKLVEAGQMRDVTELLGRRYTIRGTVLHGQGIGRVRLFPTANIVPPENSVVPKFGVYATRVYLPDGSVCVGVTNVGVRPTVAESGSVTVETYIIDYRGEDLYDQHINVEFIEYLRAEEKFPSTEELHEQIERDIQKAKKLAQ